MAEPTKKTVMPYATYQSFSNFINGLREHGMPKHITRSMLPGSNSGKASMSAALAVLGLVTAKDEPTAAMKQLADPTKNYSEELSKILLAAYPFLRDGSLNLADTTTDKVVEKFKECGASGSTITKSMSFLLSAAKDAKLEVSRYVKTPPPPSRLGGKVAKKKSHKPALNEGVDDGNHGNDPPPPTNKERIVVSAHGMEPWEIYVPKGLTSAQWKHGLKMATFILSNYRSADGAADEEDVS